MKWSYRNLLFCYKVILLLLLNETEKKIFDSKECFFSYRYFDLPISKYFWCIESYSSHTIDLNLFLSLDAASTGSCLWCSLGLLEKKSVKIYFMIVKTRELIYFIKYFEIWNYEFHSSMICRKNIKIVVPRQW